MSGAGWFLMSLSAATAAAIGFASGDSPPDSGGTLPFSPDNSSVNRLIIQAYEQNSREWKPGQLYLVGICYVAETNLGEAARIFELLTTEGADKPRAWRALGQVHHMRSEYGEATDCYTRAWRTGDDVPALTMLAGLKIQTTDIQGLKALVPDLLAHQSEDVDIQKVLLSYSLMVDDKKEGGTVAAQVARALKPEMIERNADIRKLLMAATLRYKEADAGGTNENTSQSQDTTTPGQ